MKKKETVAVHEAIEALKKLRTACTYRDAVVAAGARENLDYAVSQYSVAIEQSNNLIERAAQTG
jgi:hypothetical protein